MKLHWNKLHLQSREEICIGASVSLKLASKSWEELEPWLRELLVFSVGQRSMGRVELAAACASSDMAKEKMESVPRKLRTFAAKTKATLRYTR